jgi:hypothetical protein
MVFDDSSLPNHEKYFHRLEQTKTKISVSSLNGGSTIRR